MDGTHPYASTLPIKVGQLLQSKHHTSYRAVISSDAALRLSCFRDPSKPSVKLGSGLEVDVDVVVGLPMVPINDNWGLFSMASPSS